MSHHSNPYKQSARVAYLIEGFKQEILTEEEEKELDVWLAESEEHVDIFERLTEPTFGKTNAKLLTPGESRLSKALLALKRESFQTRIFIGLAILGVSIAFLIFYNHITSDNIPPAPNNVILQLGDGSTIDPTVSEEETVATENGITLKRTNGGELLYVGGQPARVSTPLLFNKLTTFKGSQYTVILTDGTKVMLNAESSLVYPTRFPGGDRIVELNGEAYFDVAAKMDSMGHQQPFIVKLKNGGVVKSLTSHFNVSSYEDDSIARVALFQGNAEVKRENQNFQLPILLGKNVDSNEVTGWKYGKFVFRDADIESIMRQINRWYNIRIEGEPIINARFNLTAPRNQILSKLLRQLEATGQVHFKVKGRGVYVTR